MTRVLVGSPVHQSVEILKEFLLSLTELELDGIELDYCFVDDNSDEKSIEILQSFKEENGNVTIFKGDNNHEYICDDYTHRWNEDLVMKVTRFKNRIIELAKEEDYDYLFFIDSDIVLHPKTLTRLVSTQKDIVANIFWTKWNPDVQELPQVWLKDAYTLYDARSNEVITHGEISQKTSDFINMLRKPGTYKVGGLGACTLISRDALATGVNFDPVYNISFWGEDRHFCIRAAALGIQLYVDTYYPAYHIYRATDLPGVKEYKENVCKRDTEITGAKILDLIVDGLQSVGTYSYKEELNEDFRKYFTPKEGSRLALDIKKNRDRVLKNKIINRLQAMKCEMTFYDNNTKIIAKVKYNNNGYRNSYSFYDEYHGRVVAKIQDDGTWLIDEFNAGNKAILDFIPLVRKAKESKNKLTLSMVVKNESDRYLKRVLESCREFIDNAVIIDDGSTDDTIEICKSVLSDIPLTLIENKKSKFSNETELRKQQWYETIATNPDWILFLDADEIFEEKFKDDVKGLMDNIDIDGYIFRLYDFWDEENYRDDQLWCAHNTYRPFMIRYQKNFRYTFKETSQHCGRMPENVMSLPAARSDLRLKHYGWAKLEDRISKYERYMLLDPEGKTGSLAQYQSILDKSPKLAKWNEKE